MESYATDKHMGMGENKREAYFSYERRKTIENYYKQPGQEPSESDGLYIIYLCTYASTYIQQ